MMRRLMGLAALTGALAFTATAQAGEDVGPAFRVFGDASGLPASTKAAAAEVQNVTKRCDYHEYSRMGPSPEEIAACEAAVARMVKHGPAMIAPAFAALDNRNTPTGARARLYNALARTRDMGLAEPLIKGMARIASRKLTQRSWEFQLIERAVESISRADLSVEAPWEPGVSMSSEREALHRAFSWRMWLEKNRGRSHDELAAEALAKARAEVEDADPVKAYKAVHHLLNYAEEEGIAAADKLQKRTDLPEDAHETLRWEMQEAKERIEARKAASAKAPAKPVNKTTPPAKKSAPPSKKSAPQKKLDPSLARS